MVYHVFLGFKHGELVTVILSKEAEKEDAIDCNYFICEPQEAKKQIEQWLKEIS